MDHSKDQVKEAFSKVRNDINLIHLEIDSLKNNVSEIRKSLIDLVELFKEFNEKKTEKKLENTLENTIENKIQNKPNHQKIIETPRYIQQTDRQIIPTHPTHSSTHNYQFKPLKTQNMGISIGNKGVPTDRQTDRQTHQQTDKGSYNQEKPSIDNAVEILESLDNIKKEIRLKFKRLTDQELLIFSTLYQLEEEQGFTNYKSISEKINLSESSIRDYVGRLIKKGIPIEKTKINNKTIHLNISKNLKKIASLNTILKLREL
jgi:predicted transcriptional regulator